MISTSRAIVQGICTYEFCVSVHQFFILYYKRELLPLEVRVPCVVCSVVNVFWSPLL